MFSSTDVHSGRSIGVAPSVEHSVSGRDFAPGVLHACTRIEIDESTLIVGGSAGARAQSWFPRDGAG